MSLHPASSRASCFILPRRIPNSLRNLSIQAQQPASAVASSFLSRCQSRGPTTRTQVLDSNQLQLLSLTLNRPSLFPGSSPLSQSSSTGSTSPPPGTPLPPGYHLVYFTPAFLESELGADGTDVSYNPDAPFTRRMWAGGELSWSRGADGKPNLLRVGQEVRETTRILSAEPKVIKRTGEEMLVVGVEKEFANDDGVALVDRRNWVFRKALPTSPSAARPMESLRPPTPPKPSTPKLAGSVKSHKRTLQQSAVTLFRFSALTFNPHKIHYSVPWARDVEGHRDVVVHGPLNLISILDFWRDTRDRQGEPGLLLPRSISYRATSPLYVDEKYEITLDEDKEGLAEVQIIRPDGVVAMKATVRDH